MSCLLRWTGALVVACGPGDPPVSVGAESSGGEASSGDNTSESGPPGDASSSSSTAAVTSDTPEGSSSSSGSSSDESTSTGEADSAWLPSLLVSRMVDAFQVPTLYVDPWTVELLGSDFQPSATALVGGAFLPDGETLAVASWTMEEIHLVHLAGDAPEWTLVSTIAVDGGDVSLDEEREWLWVVRRGPDGPDDFVAVDVNEGSPTFGEVTAAIEGVGQLDAGEAWAYSSARDELAYGALDGDEVVLVDADPDAASFGEVTSTLALPGSFTWLANAEYAGDGSELWVVVWALEAGVSQIARYDFESADFIDHDAVVGGIQNVGAPGSGVTIDLGSLDVVLDEGATRAVVPSGDTVLALEIDGASAVASALPEVPIGQHTVCLVETPDDALIVVASSHADELHVWRASDLTHVGEAEIGEGGPVVLVCPPRVEAAR